VRRSAAPNLLVQFPLAELTLQLAVDPNKSRRSIPARADGKSRRSIPAKADSRSQQKSTVDPDSHRVACRKCAVRLRFFYRNKRCCICRAYCFRVLVVTKAAAADAASSTTSLIPLLLWFAFWEGHVAGKYWYHRHSEAFFEDEEG
jgi:hypothetical protein